MNTRATLSLLSIALSAVVLSAPLSTPSSATTSSPPNLSGAWKLDRAHSDTPRGGKGGPPHGETAQGDARPRPELGDAGGGGRRGEGGHGPRGDIGSGPGGPPEGRHGRGPGRLPESVTVVQTVGTVELQDSTGVVLRRIITADSTAASTPGLSAKEKDQSVVETSRGTWEGQNLVVRSPGPDGHEVTQTYSLTDDGQTLKVTTHREAVGDRPAVDFTRVYHKTKSR